MVSTRSQTNSAFYSSPVALVKRMSSGTDSTALSTTGLNTTDLTNTGPVKTKSKNKKQKKELAYKSIVQTRSQKLREAMEAYDSMLNKINMFHMKHLREPDMTAKDLDEQAMATFLHNLRTQPLNTELVQKALTHMPWFHWDKSKAAASNWSLVFSVLGGLFLLTTSVGLSVWVQMSLHDTSTMYRLIGWMKLEHFD